MMRNLLVFSLTCGLLAAPVVLVGQTSVESALPLTLDAALRGALARDPQLAELRAAMEAARQRIAQARFLDPPMLEGQIWQWPVNTLNPTQVDMYMVSVSQEFPGRGKRALRAAVLQNEVALVESQAAARARQVAADVHHAYIAVVTARQAIEIYRSTLPLLRQSVAASQVRYESGSISQADVLEGVVTVSRLFDDQIVLEDSLQIATARLNTLMLRDPGAAIGALDDLVEPPPLRPIAELERTALERHPDLAAARTRHARAEAMRDEARGDFKPDVRVSGGFMLRPQQGDAWLASLGLTWPKAPWARGKVDARVAEARADADEADANAVMAEAAIKLQVRESYIKATTARQRIALLRSTLLPQSRQAIAIALTAYQTDKVDFQTVLRQQRMLLENQLAYSQAMGEAAEAIAALEHMVGGVVAITPSVAGK